MPDGRKQCVIGPARRVGTFPETFPDRRSAALIGHLTGETGGHLTAFHRAEHAGEMTMADVGETDFAVIVFREEDQWEADALPGVVTADLDDFVQALRRQPSMGGTIGFAGVDDFFFVAVRVLGDDVSMFLSRSEERRVGKECRCRWWS